MNTLLECRFMQTALGHAPCTLTDEELRSDFKDFQTALLDLLDGSGGYRTIDFMLQDTLCILEHIFSSKKNNTLLRLFVLRTRSNLRTCIAQNNKRLTNPELFTSVSPVCRSPLHWGCKPIDLAEFLVYASEFGAFGNAPFTEVVRQHGWLYNIKLGAPRDLKRSVKDRKIRTTAFIDSLQEAARQ